MSTTRTARLAAGLLALSLPLFPQGNSDNVRALNNRVLNFHAQLGGANANEAAQIRSQAHGVINQRAAALTALIKANPNAALSVAFSQDLLDDLAEKFPGSANALERHGVWSGKSDHIIFDDPARQIRSYRVNISNGSDTAEVHSAAGEPGCVSGNTLEVSGVRVGNVIAAAGANASTQGEVAAASCSSMGAQNSAIILIDFPGKPLPGGVTPAVVSDIFFATTGRSVDSYWREASYNKASATGVVLGPYTLDRVYTCDEYYSMRDAAIAAADSAINFQNYTRVFLVFADPGGCAWAGLGTLGCNTLSSADGLFTASTSWLHANYMGNRDNGVKLSTHEGGHNLTLHHASTRDHGADVLGPVGTAGTMVEYGDMYNTMGSWNLGHYGAPHKAAIGWLAASNITTTEATSSHSVLPYETATAGVQALKIRRGTGNNAWLWVEYRQPVGQYDTTIDPLAYTGGLVHYSDAATGMFTHLLDFTPGTSTFADGALTGSWTDPYTNVSMSVVGISPTALSVNVNYGAVPCVRVAPTVSLSPANPSAGSGTNVSYTLSVTNNDSTGCSASSFTLGSTAPGWTTTFGSPSLLISPATAGNTSMTKSIPAGQTPGTYAVNATAANADHATVTANANVTVVAPIFITNFTVTPNPVRLRSNASITATVTNGSTPVSGAKVTFTVTRPNGAVTTSKVITTGSNGVATYSYKAQQTGVNAARVSATSGPSSASAGPVNFTVN